MRVPIALFAISTLLIVAICVTPRASEASTLRLPSGSPLYDDLEHFRALGYWRGSLEARPLSRVELCRAAHEIAERSGELSGADFRRLRRLLRYCEEKLPGPPGAWLGDAIAREAASAGIAEPPAIWEPGLGLQFFGGPSPLDSLADLDRRPRRDGLFFLALDAEIAGRLGAQLRFYEDYSRLTPLPAGDWTDNLPPDGRGVFTDPSARLDRAVVAYGRNWWELRLGREDRRLGPGRRGSLLLSENPFPLDGLSFHFHTKHVSGTSLFAQSQRGPNPPSYMPGEAWPPEGEVQDVPGDAYLAAHRFEFRLPGPATLGLVEAVAYGGRGIDLAYANPVGFLVAMTQDIVDRSGTDDKKVVGADLRLDLPPLTLYGEFLLDRLVVLDSADDGEEAGISSFAELVGLRWANPFGLAGADLDLEYAHLDPQVYFHHDHDIRRALVTDDRLGEGRLVGHWLGPNADGLYAALRLPPLRDWGRLELEFEQARWGLVDGLRGAELGFFDLKKKDKEWLVGEVATERWLALSWERHGWRGPLPGTLDWRLSLAHVARSGAWEGSGWQAELRLNWRLGARISS